MFYHNLIRTRFPWPWAPFGVVLALLFYWGLRGELAPGLPLVLLLGALMVTWWVGQSLWAPAVVLALLLLPTGLHFTWQLPVAENFLRGQPPYSFVRIEGIIRRQERLFAESEPMMRLLLGEVMAEISGQRLYLAELELDLPVERRWWGYRGRREIRAGGALAELSRVNGRLRLRLDDPEYHMATPPLGAWSPEYLRAALQARARYYLDDPALAVYLPILLGVRERGSREAREVVAIFRRTGAAHLFAISGLHVGLLYLLFMLVAHHGTGWLLRGQGVLYLREATQIGVIVLLWGYLALIGFPVTAVRAALMGSALVWADLWGSRTPRVHVLALAALLLLAWAPSQIYDLSFQMSFLAY